MKDLYRINLNLLIALDTLIKEKNVTRAAKKLFITQAAMSNNLKQLRQLFNNELLFRNNNQLELTSFAKNLAPRLQNVLKEMEVIIQSGHDFNPTLCDKTFKVGMVDIMATFILPKLIPILKNEAPNIKISIVPLIQIYDANHFENEKFDIGIARSSENYPLPKSIHRQLVFSDNNNVCVMHPNHPLAKKKKITLDDYANNQHAAWRPDNPHFSSVVNDFLKSKGYPERNSTLHLSYTDTFFQVIEASDHLIGTVVNSAAQVYKNKYRFLIKESPIESVAVDFYIAWHRRFDEDMAHRWLRNKIIAILKEK